MQTSLFSPEPFPTSLILFILQIIYPKQKALQITELYHRYAIYTSY